MSRNGSTDTEGAQCVIWMTEGYGAYIYIKDRTTPARSAISLWRADYQKRGTDAHRVGNESPQVSAQTKNRIQKLFDGNPRKSLRAAAAKTSVADATI